MGQNVFQALVGASAGLIASLITLYFTHWSKRREELLERKRAMYDKLLRPYIAHSHELLAAKRNVQPLIQTKVGEIQELSFLLPLHVPDQIFRAFQRVQEKAIKLDTSPETDREKAGTDYYLALGDLLLEIRKDLGYKRTSLKGVDIIRNVFWDIDQYAEKHALLLTRWPNNNNWLASGARKLARLAQSVSLLTSKCDSGKRGD